MLHGIAKVDDVIESPKDRVCHSKIRLVKATNESASVFLYPNGDGMRNSLLSMWFSVAIVDSDGKWAVSQILHLLKRVTEVKRLPYLMPIAR